MLEPQSASHPSRLASAARELSALHTLSDLSPRPLPAWSHIKTMPDWLVRARISAMAPTPEAGKAAEWLLDNDYQVERAIFQVRQDLPRGFYRRLPALAGEDDQGLPRVLGLAHGLLRASHLQLSQSTALEFLNAYQEMAPLTIAELWALPTMLRLACLEFLVSSLNSLFPGLWMPFAPTRHAAMTGPFENTECVSRAIVNLGIISSIQWKEFFERSSWVESHLRRDPSGVYPRMELDTRDYYRQSIEDLADRSGRAEWLLAQEVVARSAAAAKDGPGNHVGYWLVGEGRAELEKAIDYRPTPGARVSRWGRRHTAPIYVASLAAGTISILALVAFYLVENAAGPGALALGMLVGLPPALGIAVTLVHWLATLLVTPRLLPKLEFESGIPADCATAIVIPALIGTASEVSALIDRLEMHRLSNPDPLLQFVLLSDYRDAPTEQMADDALVDQALKDGIVSLNSRYAPDSAGPFHVLHRPRLFNSAEGVWMGWERKRGKIEQFNEFLLTGQQAAFSFHEGRPRQLLKMRFVVTMDADTRLPPGSVNRLIGTLAHPLNKADFDPITGSVRTGYTVIQPRVDVALSADQQSLFTRFYAGDAAIDIYSRAVSDIYQDLFATGIYVGKGIYEVEPFRRCLTERIPENSLLSHDLFEGIHGRAGLASDIIIHEDFPTGYLDFARRWHRWIRGDWQLLPWLLGQVPGRGGSRLKSPLSWLDRWKIFDNLRRSLVALSALALLVVAWLALPGNPWVWTMFALGALGAHLLADLVSGLTRARARGAYSGTLRGFSFGVGRWLLAIAFLVQDTVLASDAIVRTLWRLFISRRRLQEWVPAAHAAARLATLKSRPSTWRLMWIGPAASVGLAGLVFVVSPASFPAAAPLLLLWLLAPEIALFIRRPRVARIESLGTDDHAFLRRLARRTWLFFETFIGPDDNWLPPDNFQEVPQPEVAHRTSPTNIGMLFLSTLTAWDLGYVSLADLATRLRYSFDTLGRLERHRGHLLNWYDTRTLHPLEPRYVSTVDSGNLAVSLLAVKEGCLETLRHPVFGSRMWLGLADNIDALVEALEAASIHDMARIRKRIEADFSDMTRKAADEKSWNKFLTALCDVNYPDLESEIRSATMEEKTLPSVALRDIQIWLERLRHHLLNMRREVDTLLPWLALTAAPPLGFRDLADEIAKIASPSLPLISLREGCTAARTLIARRTAAVADAGATAWLAGLDDALRQGEAALAELEGRLRDIAGRAETLAFEMDFQLVFDWDCRLFHIGYNVSANRIDPHHYDLLASEARIASFFAIAKSDVPCEHWMFLARPITTEKPGLALISWGGSMFEYLMPTLFLSSEPGTLLGQSDRTAVDAQRLYANKIGIPWGMSESAFASQDPEHHYRYRAFGVPGLGLRRGLYRNLVVAPYATALALGVRPRASVENLRRLMHLGIAGRYGLLEAADFTPERAPPGRQFALVSTYMAHHQGMILAAIGNALTGNALVRRVHADARIRANELLLHERIPWQLPPEINRSRPREALDTRRPTLPALHAWQPSSADSLPSMHVLGNGRLASWVSEAGAGGLWWNQHALLRWLPDATLDRYGLWIYVRDEESGQTWSVGRRPIGTDGQDVRVVFHPHMAEFHRHDFGIRLTMEVGVAPADDLEIRRITLTNDTDQRRVIGLTSYAEPVLAPPIEDERHPAFSKLSVGGEWLPDIEGLLFTRRPRDPGDRPPVLLHRLISDATGIVVTAFETDRRSFIGRHGNARRPRGLVEGLTNTLGWTLDPAMALQARIELKPNETRRLAFLTLVASSRESVLAIAERHATLDSVEWILRDAVGETAQEAHRLGLAPAHLPELQALASLLLFPQPRLRADPSRQAANKLGQPGLWPLGISGDHPILVLHTSEPARTDLLRLLVRAHQYWRRRGLRIDLAVIRTGASSYSEPLRETLVSLMQEVGEPDMLGRRNGVHLVVADQASADSIRALYSAAHVILDESRGSLAQQLAGAQERRVRPPRFEAAGGPEDVTKIVPLPRPIDLRFDNGHGGFSADGREYVIHLDPGRRTPSPWCNILANDVFGCIVTEAGMAGSWSLNSGENRLTPWSNDPVRDPPSEALYLRDEETGAIWTPTPLPAGMDFTCQIRHGAGYTTWQQSSHALAQELLVFVPDEAPVKIARLRLRNPGARARRITATYYAEWLLGSLWSRARPFVVCTYDAANQAILAENHWNPEFGERVAFLAASQAPHSLTTSRSDFLGREGDLRQPEGLRCWDLGGHVGPVAEPCAALQVHLDIAAGSAAEIVFVLGQGDDRGHAEQLVRQWREPEHVSAAHDRLTQKWDSRLAAVQVRSPDPAFDLMINRWLLYQAISARILGRAGFYQAGGAIGFRDQIQDVLALIHAEPTRVRAHILVAAGRQFEEGDVLHWWHPPADRGVRTHCSDDLLWLPYAASFYVAATGDESILGELVPFLHGPPLAPEEGDRYAKFEPSAERRSLFEHCRRALERGVTEGAHGLPLMGGGDWNDGMGRIGHRGRGESVWLAWFAIAAIRGFVGMCRRMGRDDLTALWTKEEQRIQEAVERTGWDGEWYLRAIDDDGRAIGSAGSEECAIDSITQSWSVLSGAGTPERAEKAMNAASRELIRQQDGVIALLWPPFGESLRDPGYIKAYPPGIRENGGQYTHAAAWLGFAFSILGDADQAMRVFALTNPINHALSEQDCARYLVEPYVVAADISSVAPHVGRGGWTWYTGAASWLWRLGVEGILGLRLENGDLRIKPGLPSTWDSVFVEVRGPQGSLAIKMQRSDLIGADAVTCHVDGAPHPGLLVSFPTDGSTRHVRIGIGKSTKAEVSSRAAGVVSVKTTPQDEMLQRV